MAASDRIERRLAAIMSADMVSYSRLMEADEVGTIARQRSHRSELIDPTIRSFNGRIVKTTGDGMLLEFASAVDAVECAVDIQNAMLEREADRDAEQRIQYRIGINVGDIVIDGDDILGEGVNVAARLEGLAQPGGIAISGNAHEQTHGKLAVEFEDGGQHTVKNIARPVHVWLWQPLAGDPATRVVDSSEPPSLPVKPSIAVLPFDNMSNDPGQEYFSDGISEDLTTALSHFDGLFVVARNSAFTYKGQAVDVKRVGRELGVRYVLEGSVRLAGNRVRINAQLVDAVADRHVWADRFDREVDDVFELQDDIVASIAAIAGPEITMAEVERARTKRPETLDAWDHYLQAISAYHKMTKEDLDAAIALLEKAIAIEPEFANAHALLGICHTHAGMRGWVRPVRDAFASARRHAEEAVRLARSSPETNHALAFVLMATGEAEAAVATARRAIELNANYAEAHAVLGHALIFCGKLEEGLAECQIAARYSPRDTRGSWLYDAMGHAYFMLGEYETAIDVSKKALQLDPSVFGALVTLACAHACLGQEAEAKCAVDTLLGYIPRYNLRALQKNPMFVDPALIEKLVDSMRLAGLPE